MNHLELAHRHWKENIGSEDTVIDATCGNGQDTLYLAKLHPKTLYALDIQPQALKNTAALLQQDLSLNLNFGFFSSEIQRNFGSNGLIFFDEDSQSAIFEKKSLPVGREVPEDHGEKPKVQVLKDLSKIHFVLGCHSSFPPQIEEQSVQLIAYNLGYLPGGDKNLTTQTKTTLSSLQRSLSLLKKGGILSITCYSGHAEGKREEEAVLTWAKDLNKDQWSVCYHQWINKIKAPSLLFLTKIIL